MTALTVLVTGGSSASGVAAARALATAGHRVLTVGSDPARIQAAAAEAGGGVEPMVSDLASLESVQELARTLEDRGIGGVDGVIHLVGGWRGAKGIEDQSDDDWQAMERSAVTTLRNVSRVFYGQLEKSPNGRFAMVSSTTASAPTAATASYAAAKSAAEAWTLSIADGFRRSASNDSTSTDSQSTDSQESSAAVILVVKALVDPAMRLKNPERRFPGYTDVEDLASAVVELFTQPAAQLNGQRILLAK
ncbi:SDR family NAD(P)-dependent oxidoreductase [Paenarthrobacter ilicis]|uniref:NAD(P)-dependent dehydrogenase (Short-subunit alcohol dehydrogenase family) n=1 Tax=Paenarthrobacter ilicis TaxID=43665 RepID=A0ABX0TMY8_9MICC|nr:SDR family NAD(P)-dependent oxidoreductase [Paenarthrobacter ilicis]MBM7792994.1 NAD(P)-dependent dehydrogenase (short-subunit alcohol dehydrogenase family) [Paenarthrobacter ilicis]NIJ03071.1 NAD(P)-dependent dehydrogenase (short-subunit alcohol dehydrogenase family) [Paenarthrobacter ilicis]